MRWHTFDPADGNATVFNRKGLIGTNANAPLKNKLFVVNQLTKTVFNFNDVHSFVDGFFIERYEMVITLGQYLF